MVIGPLSLGAVFLLLSIVTAIISLFPPVPRPNSPSIDWRGWSWLFFLCATLCGGYVVWHR